MEVKRRSTRGWKYLAVNSRLREGGKERASEEEERRDEAVCVWVEEKVGLEGSDDRGRRTLCMASSPGPFQLSSWYSHIRMQTTVKNY